MKRILLFCMAALMLLCRTPTFAALTYDQSYYIANRAYLGAGNFNDPLYNIIGEVETILEGTAGAGSLYLTPTDTEPGTSEGMFYADDSENILKYYNGSAWVGLGSGTFTGGSITSNITMSNGVYMRPTTTTAHVTGLQVYDTDGSWENALLATNGSTAAVVLGDTAATLAISSSGGLNVTTAGAVSGVTTLAMGGALSGVTTINASGVTTVDSLALTNGATIANSTDTEITFGENTEDLAIDFLSDAVGLKSSTGVVTFGFGDVDALTGINTITMDAAASTVTLAADGAGDDLTVSVTGAQDSSLVLSSAGTAADALQVTTTAGGIDITNGGAAGGEDLDILSSNASVNIIAREDDADAVVIATTGGGGTSESINIQNDSGTAESAIDIDATAGGIDIDAATGKNIAVTGGQFIVTSNEDVASAINLVTNTGTSETIVATNTQGTSESAITLTSTAGGIDLNAAATKNITLDGGQVLLTGTQDTASAIALTTNVGTSETIVATNTQGTGAGAVTLTATAGGVDIDAAAAKDVAIDGGQVAIGSKDDAASAIALTTNVGTSETIVVTNTQGTAAGAITLTATAGGITLGAAAEGKGVTLTSDIYVKKGSDVASPAGGELDLGNGTFFDITGTNNITSIAAADSIAGRLIVLQFDGVLTFTDGNNLKIAGNMSTTADDTITLICDGTNWWEISRSAN